MCILVSGTGRECEYYSTDQESNDAWAEYEHYCKTSPLRSLARREMLLSEQMSLLVLCLLREWMELPLLNDELQTL